MDKCEKAFRKYFFHNFTLKIIIAHICALAIFVLLFCILLKLPKSVMGLNDFSTEQEILYATNSVAIISTFIVILLSVAYINDRYSTEYIVWRCINEK